jgi:hypothetical protein
LRHGLLTAEDGLRQAAGRVLRAARLERRAVLMPPMERRPVEFRAYRPGGTAAPVIVVTPPDGDFLHTFFDVCPLSRSGRLLAVTRLPFTWRPPLPGDLAEVCVIDLVERTIRSVWRTDGWALQLGANLHWHPREDDILFCNVRGAGSGAAVRIDTRTGDAAVLDGPVYVMSPDGRWALSPALDLINRTQQGYGVPEPWLGRRVLLAGLDAAEGIWRTDLDSGRRELFLSVDELARNLPTAPLLAQGRNHVFHVKLNADGSRGFAVLRSRGLSDRPQATRASLVTFTAAGNRPALALPHDEWDRGGHHPSWLPAGRRILMNLVPAGERTLRFVTLAPEGGVPTVLAPGCRGSGHPSLDPTGRLLVSDAYLNEGFGAADGEAPLRAINPATGVEWLLASLDCGPANLRARRIDPHPAWGRDGRSVVVNVCIGGRRQVAIADLLSVLPTATASPEAREQLYA